MRSPYNEIIIKYVAEYLRKSRGESNADLIKHKTVLEELCKRRGWVYVPYEEIETGESLQRRPVMQQLLKDLVDNMYDAVVCVDLDRLGRGTLGEWDYIKQIFQQTNTYIVTPNSLYNLSDDNDEFAVDLQTVFARREYKKITQRLTMGKKVGAKLGAWTNGVPPFPYEYQEWVDPETHKRYFNPKGLVVNLEKLKVYRSIVEMFIKEKKSANEIAWILNRQGYKTVNGCRWHPNSVRRLLLDEIHLGKIVCNKTKGDGHKDRPNKPPVQKIPKEQWTVVENRHEAVKTQEEHEQILICIQKNAKSAFRRSHDATPLKGLVKCSLCGHTLCFGYRQHKSGTTYTTRKCWYKDINGHSCPNESGPAKYILEAIDTQLDAYELQIKAEIENCEGDSTDIIQSNINDIMKAINKKEVALQRARVAYDEGVDTLDEYRSAKARIGSELDALESQLHVENIKLKRAQSVTDVEKLHYIEEFKRLKKDGSLSDQELNDLYKTIISDIVWLRQGDKIEIKVNFL